MLTRFAFWFIFYPISLLPLWIIYIIMFPFYLIVNFLVRYRKKVITENLRLSFPDKPCSEIRHLRNVYYWYLAQIAAEMIKMLTLSRKNVMKRYRCSNPEVVNKFFEEGRSVVLMSGHYNNWEWLVLSLDLQFKHKGIGVGSHNTNQVFEKLINKARTRYGDQVVFNDNVRDAFAHHETNHIPAAYLILADQSPSNPKRCYVTDFLNRKTGFIRGAEGYARKYNLPVLYYDVIKERMGYYRFDVKLITDSPNELPEGAIMQRYVELLEQTIRRKPEFWLWSHRRWKHNFEKV